jgi:predicted GNAT family acetyltransferase
VSEPIDRPQVVDRPYEGRLVVDEDGTIAELIYRIEGDRLVLVHTGVPDELGGRGIGSLLVKAAVEKATREHLTLVPWCPFARRWLRDHPDAVAADAIDWRSIRPSRA